MNTNALYNLTAEDARDNFPLWLGQEAESKEKKDLPRKHQWELERERLKKRYGIALIAAFVWAASMMLGCCVTGWAVKKSTLEEARAEYAQMLVAHKEEQQQAQAAEYFLSGEASKEAFINQETDAVAAVIAKLKTDAQKSTEAACLLARVMSPLYPNTFQEVASQPSQWMFYDGTDKTFSQHDREIAESIVRPYLENGIIPNGLTAEMVYGAWSTNDFVLRDSYENSSTMHTWRYSG